MNAQHLKDRIAWERNFCALGIERLATTREFGTPSKYSDAIAEVVASWSEIKRLVAIARQYGWTLEDLQADRALTPDPQWPDTEIVDVLPGFSIELLREHLTRSLEHRVLQYVGWAKAELQRQLRMSPDEFEEFQLAEATPIEMELANRDIIQSLLHLVAQDPRHAELQTAVATGDTILKAHGFDILGPLFRSGELKQIRDRGVQPIERWWYYLDSKADAQ